jgi:hypothetical protein
MAVSSQVLNGSSERYDSGGVVGDPLNDSVRIEAKTRTLFGVNLKRIGRKYGTAL